MHSKLLQPEHSVRLGAVYLRRLLNQFDGNWALAAAAYNAGPHRVKTWLSQFGHLDLDEFIEHIPFRETRLYVKRVAVNSAQYQEIHQLRTLDFAKLVIPFQERLRNFTVVTKESWEDIN
jgi:soluble lytic murein transglycosylase